VLSLGGDVTGLVEKPSAAASGYLGLKEAELIQYRLTPRGQVN